MKSGIPSPWWRQIIEVGRIASQLSFHKGDCLQLLPNLLQKHKDAAVFVDPPYSASGGEQAGKRLYRHFRVDHAKVFQMLADFNVNFLMTYDMADEIIDLVQQHGFNAVRVSTRSNRNNWRRELIITRDSMFDGGNINKVDLFA